jgi:hypothetical protein
VDESATGIRHQLLAEWYEAAAVPVDDRFHHLDDRERPD